MLDGAICLLDAVAGVEPQTETVWRQGDKYHVPRMVFRQQDGSHRRRFLSLRRHGQKTAEPRTSLFCNCRLAPKHEFKGIIDLRRMKAVIWEDEALGAKFHDEEIPADLLDKAKEYRHEMLETARRNGRRRDGRLSGRQRAFG